MEPTAECGVDTMRCFSLYQLDRQQFSSMQARMALTGPQAHRRPFTSRVALGLSAFMAGPYFNCVAFFKSLIKLQTAPRIRLHPPSLHHQPDRAHGLPALLLVPPNDGSRAKRCPGSHGHDLFGIDVQISWLSGIKGVRHIMTRDELLCTSRLDVALISCV